jgi:hypothetical protein
LRGERKKKYPKGTKRNLINFLSSFVLLFVWKQRVEGKKGYSGINEHKVYMRDGLKKDFFTTSTLTTTTITSMAKWKVKWKRGKIKLYLLKRNQAGKSHEEAAGKKWGKESE